MKPNQVKNQGISRRDWLRNSVGVAGAITASGVFGKALAASVCRMTPTQTEGPFYPVNDQADKNTDLTQVLGRAGRAKGQVIYVEGVVTDSACAPIAGVLVEIWQACHTGKYNHPGDDNPAALDPDFQYWGQALTADDGRYRFKTILPGAYPASPDWIRPPHIHFKAHKRGYHELTTQMYFDGEELNRRDLILAALSPSQQQDVIVQLNDAGPELEPGAKTGQFNLVLRSVQ